jgi:Flp pilus assembly protein TadG
MARGLLTEVSGVRNQSGQAIVELAVSLVLVLLILLAALDLGRAFFSYIAIVNAAREGARSGSILSNPAAIAPAARQEVSGNGLDPSRLSVTYQWGGTLQPLVVTVSYPFDLITSGVLPFTRITLSSSATMMVQ